MASCFLRRRALTRHMLASNPCWLRHKNHNSTSVQYFSTSSASSAEPTPDHGRPRQAYIGEMSFYQKQYENNIFFRQWKGINIKWTALLCRRLDLSIPSIRQWLQQKIHQREVDSQRFLPERKTLLGSDIAAAYMIQFMGGSIRFSGQKHWLSKKLGNSYELPVTRVPKLFVEAVNLEGTEVMYEGLENLDKCRHLQWLSLSDCMHVDDWCLDRISSASYRHSLKHLDLSRCKGITERGLAVLHRFGSLETLILSDMPNVQHKELMCMLLEEVLPNCTIKGIDYLSDATRDELIDSVLPKKEVLQKNDSIVINNEERVVARS